ncbi:MAG: hypothetical protein R3C32_00550 [Chloroflexota bacterium]
MEDLHAVEDLSAPRMAVTKAAHHGRRHAGASSFWQPTIDELAHPRANSIGVVADRMAARTLMEPGRRAESWG